jgi:hypothetical protein
MRTDRGFYGDMRKHTAGSGKKDIQSRQKSWLQMHWTAEWILFGLWRKP